MASLSDRLVQPSRRPAAPPARRTGTRAAFFLVFAVLSALGAGLLLHSYLTRRAAGAAMATTKVVVAAVDIPLASTLRPELLVAVDFPRASVPAGAHADPAALAGRVVVAPLVKGEPLLESKLASEKAGKGLAAILPENMRAVAVKVDDVVGVAGFVHPGDSVDVIVTMKSNESSNVPPTSKVILQNVRVLAVGKELDHKDQRNQKAVPVTVATLMVTSPDSEKLALASTKGQILLALRSRVDLTEVETSGIVPAVLLEGGSSAVAITNPAAAPAAVPAASDSGTGSSARPAEPRPRPRPVVVRRPAAEKPAPAPAEHQVEILRGDRFETRQFPAQEAKP